MTKKFNGTTVNFGGNVAGILSARSKEGGAMIDVSDANGNQKQYEAGLKDPSVSVEVVGSTSITFGQAGSLSVSYPDGTSTSMGNAVCSSVEKGGSKDNPLTATLEFKPAP